MHFSGDLQMLLAEGRFGVLAPGIPLSDVIAKFGKSALRSSLPCSEGTIDVLQYGALELSFFGDTCRLYQIQIDFYVGAPRIPKRLFPNWHFPTALLDRNTFQAALDESEIKWSLHEPLTFDDQIALITEAETLVLFDSNEDRLGSICRTRETKGTGKAPVKAEKGSVTNGT